MTTENSDPNLHWDGTRWLRWTGTEWTDAETGAALRSPTSPTDAVAQEPKYSEKADTPSPKATKQPKAPKVRKARKEKAEPETYGRPDVDAAAERMDTKLGSKREIKKLIEHLWDTEKVEILVGGTYGGGMGLLALTNSRLVFLRDSWTSEVIEDFPLDKVTSVQWKSGMLTGSVIIFASGNKSEIKNLSKAGGKALTDSVRGSISNLPNQSALQTPDPHNTASPSPGVDPVAQIKQLGELRDTGVLTDEEFASKKAEILSRI